MFSYTEQELTSTDTPVHLPPDSPDTSTSGQGRHDHSRDTEECMPITRMCDAIPMPPADTLESSSDSVPDCIHQYDHALYQLEHCSDDDR